MLHDSMSYMYTGNYNCKTIEAKMNGRTEEEKSKEKEKAKKKKKKPGLWLELNFYFHFRTILFLFKLSNMRICIMPSKYGHNESCLQ